MAGRQNNDVLNAASLALSEYCRSRNINVEDLIKNGLAGSIDALSDLTYAFGEDGINYNSLITILVQKNRKKSYLPISDTLAEELNKLYALKTSDYVFVNPLTNKPYINIRNTYTKVLKQAKITNFNFHSLRHTACTRMLEKGVEIDVVKEIMRHSNISITLEVYNHINQDRKIEAIRVLNDYSK